MLGSIETNDAPSHRSLSRGGVVVYVNLESRNS
jgi:hypothetical protein